MYYLFNELTEDEYKKIIKYVKIETKEYKKGDIIAKENSLCTSIGYVKKGTVIAKNLFSDNEQQIKLITSTKTFGEALIFVDDNRYKASFIALKDCKIEYISKTELLNLIKIQPKISFNLLKQVSTELIQINDHKKILAAKTVRKKFLEFLLIESQKNDKLAFLIDYTKTELSLYLNVERPTLSKEIHYLQNNGVITNNKNIYEILDLDYIQNNI